MQTEPRRAPPAQTAAVGLRAFFALMERWRLSADEAALLLGCPRSTYYQWRRSPPSRLGHDTLERISYLLGIHKALRLLFSRHEASVTDWVRKPNDAPPFGGRSALDRMLSGNVADLYEVRTYLDAQRGGWA
jgi:hypothetical protein